MAGVADDDWSPRTRAVAAGRPDGAGEPLNTPIVPASTFNAGAVLDGVSAGKGTSSRAYSREDGTPTWAALEEAIGVLEGGRATAFASGIATAAAVFDLLYTGTEVAVPTYCYAGTRGALDHAELMGR